MTCVPDAYRRADSAPTLDVMEEAPPLSLSAAAEASGLPVHVLYGLIVRGQLTARHDPDSQAWVIDPEDLRRYIECT